MSQIDNLTSGVVERLQAHYKNGADIDLDSPTWWRLQRSMLIDLKTALKDMIPDTIYYLNWGGWINTNDLPDTGLNISNYLFSVSSLCVACAVPINYFDYTPWRGLNGLGGYTNDSTVGHPHGWTNEHTVAGGTNFPPGRTNWYTTDYGFDQLRSLLSNMTVYCYEGGVFSAGRGILTTTTQTNDYGSPAYTVVAGIDHPTNNTVSSFDAALSDMLAGWASRSPSPFPWHWWDGWYPLPGYVDVLGTRTNETTNGTCYIYMTGGYTWSFAFPPEASTNYFPLAVRLYPFSVDVYTAWQGTNWLGYPGAQDATNKWETISSASGITTNKFGSVEYMTTISGVTKDSYVGESCNVGTENYGDFFITTWDFNYK